MQRYRVNYGLLIALVIGGIAATGVSFLLWRFQVNRNATRLLAKADAAEKEGNVEEAYESLDKYVRLRVDETDAQRRFGQVALKLSNQDELDMKVRQDAYAAIVSAVKVTNDAKLRRDLVDLQLKYGAFDLALQNINELLDAGKGDAELKALKVQCLFVTQKAAEGAQLAYRLVGYDQKTNEFDAAKAEAPNQPVVYALLAEHLRNSREPELSNRVIEQMIASNPESREAYVFQYQFMKAEGKKEIAREALEKAYELDPSNDAVLNFKGIEAITDFQAEYAAAEEEDSDEKRESAKARLDEAAKFFKEALERYPNRIGFYLTAAKIESNREKIDDALAIIKRGLDKFPLKTERDRTGLPAAIELVNLKIEILLAQQKYDAIKAEIEQLRALDNSRINSLAEFQEARLDAVNNKWAEAAESLQTVKPRLLSFPDLQAEAGAIQGFCHTQLGQFDLAAEAYEWTLARQPNNPRAIAGLNGIRGMIGSNAVQGEAPNLDSAIQAMLQKPKAEQDWESIAQRIDAYIDEQAESRPVTRDWIDSRKKLLRGQMLAMRAVAAADENERKELFVEARTAITEAAKVEPNDPTVQIAAIRLLAQEPQNGPAIALKRLDQVLKRNKDSAAFRVLRVELLAAIRDEKLPEQLQDSTKGMESWDDNQQALVWSAVGSRYEQIGKFAEAQEAMTRAAELTPTNLPARMAMFELALKQNDDAAMKAAQEKILEIVKNKSEPGYVLTEIKRRLVGFAGGVVNKEQLQEARTMLDAAIKQRPGMPDLHVANGQMYLLLERDVPKALVAFDEALKHGPPNFNAIGVQIRLLADAGRVREARQKMDLIPVASWSMVLDRYAADILRSVGETASAYSEAQKILQAKPNDDKVQLWFAEIALQAEKLEDAEKALKKAIEINSSEPEYWTRLVTLYLQQKRFNDVEATMREALIALDEEFLPLLTGRYYELQGRWQEAEDIYLAAYVDKWDDLPVLHRMAEFYLQWSGKNEANRGKAAVYLNRLLRASYEGKAQPNDPNVVWARQRTAQLLSMNEDYQDSLKAERLLTEAVEGQGGTMLEQEYLIDVLGLRGDPLSRERVVQLLRESQAVRALSPERELHLGHALFELGRWEECKTQMEDAIGRHPDNLGLQTAYASMLISRKDVQGAERWIARLSDRSDAARPVAELRLRLANAKGDKDEIRSVLVSMTPNLRALTEEQLKGVRSVALLAEGVGDKEYALNLMREYARRSPGNDLELARFVTQYGPIDDGLTMLKQVYDSNIDEVVSLAVNMLRARRAESPEKLDAEITRIVQAARRDDPESARRMVLEAELMEIQERFDDAIALYKELLARDDVPKRVRATALNNAAFLIALKSTKTEDLDFALKYANEAVELIGPLSDILDTRALVYLARGEFDKAAEDMKLAVKMGATLSKYYHLAAAYLGAGDQQAALEAWERAEAEGVQLEKVNIMERPVLEAFQKKIEALRGSAPQL